MAGWLKDAGEEEAGMDLMGWRKCECMERGGWEGGWGVECVDLDEYGYDLMICYIYHIISLP